MPCRGDSIIRHNRLVRVVQRYLMQAGFAPRTEEPYLLLVRPATPEMSTFLVTTTASLWLLTSLLPPRFR
jgi:hypothetical protein